MPDESVQAWINKNYLRTYLLICDKPEKHAWPEVQQPPADQLSRNQNQLAKRLFT